MTFDIVNLIYYSLAAVVGGVSTFFILSSKLKLLNQRVDKLEAERAKDNEEFKQFVLKFETKIDSLKDEMHNMSIALTELKTIIKQTKL